MGSGASIARFGASSVRFSGSSSPSSLWSIAAPGEKLYSPHYLFEKEEFRSAEYKVEVSIASCRIGAFFGVHHAIVLHGAEMPSGESGYLVFEWGPSGVVEYTCRLISSKANWCVFNLGSHSLVEVKEAVERISLGRSYSVTHFNCNHWCDCVAAELGHEITTHFNCACVLPDWFLESRFSRLLVWRGDGNQIIIDRRSTVNSVHGSIRRGFLS